MKKFIIKTLIFTSPILFLAALNFLFLKDIGELKSPTELSLANQKDGALIGLSYSDSVKQFKFKNIQSRKPEVIALGTSRVLQFRDLYFQEPYDFYNAGQIITKLNDIVPLIKNYPGDLPKIIILGLDQDLFSYHFDNLSENGFNDFTSTSDLSSRILACSRTFTADILKGKVDWSLWGNSDSSKIGLTALTYNEGFRVDGSYLYGRKLLAENDPEAYQFTDIRDRISKQNSRFKHSHINPKAIIEFEKILTICAKKNIHLITFLPPYANSIYIELENQKEQYPFIFQLHETLAPLCTKYHFSIYDFSDLQTIGANDFETVDGFHGSETAYLKIINLLSANEPELGKMLNTEQIKHLMENPYSARQLLPELNEAQPKKSSNKLSPKDH